VSTRILFLTEAGDGIGFGHLSRSIALADGFESLDCDITFIVRVTEKPVIQNRPYREQNKEWIDKKFLDTTIPLFDLTVVDSYRINDEMLNYISEKSENPVFLIDSQLKYGYKGILLFPSVYADEYTFSSSKQVQILSGIKYLLYTKEMWKELSFEVNEKVKRIGMSLGSSTLNLNGLRIEKFKHLFPGLVQICIFGNLNIKESIDNDQIEVTWMARLGKEDYVAKLQSLDLLISNGGQTLNEALLIGLPVLPLITAENQLKNVTGWERKNLVSGLDSRNRLDSYEFFEKLKILKDFNTRKEYHEKCRHTVDSNGAIRAAEKILKLSTN